MTRGPIYPSHPTPYRKVTFLLVQIEFFNTEQLSRPVSLSQSVVMVPDIVGYGETLSLLHDASNRPARFLPTGTSTTSRRLYADRVSCILVECLCRFGEAL
jgi:hypothetical protein